MWLQLLHLLLQPLAILEIREVRVAIAALADHSLEMVVRESSQNLIQRS
jgi:hypothetical protein